MNIDTRRELPAVGAAAATQAGSLTAVTLTVNGAPVTLQVEPRTSLADLLRDQLRLSGTHVSCEQGVCGACTVLLDDRPVRACITWALACEGRSVQTIEGFDHDPKMAELREAFSREHALQCGFCTPGMLITARDIATRLPGVDENRVRHELSGNLCRCTGYAGIVRAVCSVAGSAAATATKASAGSAASAASRATGSAGPADAFRTFEPTDEGAPRHPGTATDASTAVRASPSARGETRISETVTLRGCTPERLWTLLADVGAAAACLPGASVERYDGREIAGAVRVSFGPVKARFVGAGIVERDDAARAAMIRGTATDALSKTQARAEIDYRVEADPAAADAARLDIGIDYSVQGPLAQFSRSDLVRSLVGQLVREFGRNLEAMARGAPAPAPSAGLSAFGLLWRWLAAKLSALAGRREPRR